MNQNNKRTANNDRVGMFLNPHTRNRLNKLKADLSLDRGEVLSQDDVIVLLLNHFAATTPALSERVRELA